MEFLWVILLILVVIAIVVLFNKYRIFINLLKIVLLGVCIYIYIIHKNKPFLEFLELFVGIWFLFLVIVTDYFVKEDKEKKKDRNGKENRRRNI